jgi:aspartate aminotransferase-like enzyme
MPTDTIARLGQAIADTEAFGFDRAKRAQQELGERVRRVMVDHGMASVAAAGFQAPTVVVSYTTDPGIQSGAKFVQAGLQTAAGVPLQCDEGTEFRTFRVGLFGLDKLGHIDRTVVTLDEALRRITR